MTPVNGQFPWHRAADGGLLVLLATTVFLLGCYEMMDSDIWWHLRAGQWILEHRRVPHLDPFTFGSEDRVWIDIHWSYQVVLALTYRAGGIGGVVLLGAALGTLAVLVALTARRREWPVPVVIGCWVPALVLLSFRLDPRPELFSLVYLGCFLTVLFRVDDRPRLVWLLPAVQVLWVNVQGLFVLGPVLLGLCLTARAAETGHRGLRGEPAWNAAERRWWRHVGGAALAVAAACLVNPYGLDGARFPLDLFPKVADPNNPYKQHIDELKSPREYLTAWYTAAPVARAHWPFVAFHFLLLLLPLSFLIPAVWRAGRAVVPAPVEPARGEWGAGTALAIGLMGAHALAPFAPDWAAFVAPFIPHALAVAGGYAALRLRHTSKALGALVCAGSVAQAVWMIWLRSVLLCGEQGLLGGTDYSADLRPLLVLAVLTAGGLAVRCGARVFPILLAGVFAYFGLQAIQNWSRFALVAGTVLMWNFGAWAAELAPSEQRPRREGWLPRAVLAGILGLWIAALATDRYYPATGEDRHFGFREQPFEFAHEAAAFAGQPGLPDRALVYDLGQTGVYDFHNAPRCKPFMDGRLEMPAQHTFETYVAVQDGLQRHDPRWEPVVAGMGHPLLLVSHKNNFAAEARLLTHPDWRCVHYDPVAAVFVHRARGVSEDRFPSVNFAARHFQRPRAVPAVPGAAAREARALFNLATALPRASEEAWKWRVPVVLGALDRSRLALAEDPARAETWYVLGSSFWFLDPDMTGRPPSPADDWQLDRTIYWAQTTYCLRRALACEPGHRFAWRALYQSYAVRGMTDAQAACGQMWLEADPRAGPGPEAEIARANEIVRARSGPASGSVPDTVTRLLNDSRPAEAARVLDAADRESAANWSWEFADRAAGLHMHLGRPADARLIWERARCPSESLRRCRVAATFWVEGELDSAVQEFRRATETDPKSDEAWWGLAMVRAQQGDATAARDACRAALRATPTDRRRVECEALLRLVTPPER